MLPTLGSRSQRLRMESQGTPVAVNVAGDINLSSIFDKYTFVVTVPDVRILGSPEAAASMPLPFTVTVVNAQTARSVRVTLTGADDLWLYPRQSAIIYVAGGQWRIIRDKRWQLTSNWTMYASPSGGSGDAMTSGSPMGLEAVILTLCRDFDFNSMAVTVQLAVGTYSGGLYMPSERNWIGGGSLRILGNPSAPGSYIFTANPSNHALNINGSRGGPLIFEGLRVTSPGSFHAFCSANSSQIYLRTMEWGPAGWAHIGAYNAVIDIEGDQVVNGGGSQHIQANWRSIITHVNSVTTISGSPSFSEWVQMDNATYRIWNLTYSGAVSGKRYNVVNNGAILGTGININYFPGTIAGTTSFGGVYN